MGSAGCRVLTRERILAALDQVRCNFTRASAITGCAYSTGGSRLDEVRVDWL
jgi:hypothetical protein